jgi:hypothetical protein
MGSTSAYWITPKGEILKPNAYHIGSVMKNPSKFGMTTDELKKYMIDMVKNIHHILRVMQEKK